MYRVIRTKTPKIEMLTAGLPMVSSAARTSGTADLLVRAAAGGGLVILEAPAHLVGDRVGRARRVAYVELGDEERRHELPQPQQDAEVHVAEDLRLHERRRVRGEQDVEEVPDEERHGGGDDEAAEPPAQFGELRGVLGLAVLLRREHPPVVRSCHGAASCEVAV